MLAHRFLALSVAAAFLILSAVLFYNRGHLSNSVTVPSGWTASLEYKIGHAWSGGKQNKGLNHANEAFTEGDFAVSNGFIQDDLAQHKGEGAAHDRVATPTSVTPALPSPTAMNSLQGRISITIVESSGSNDEITASLIHSFGKQNSSRLSLYTLQQGSGIDEIINNFDLPHPLAANKSVSVFEGDLAVEETPSIVVAATCETDLISLDSALTRLLVQKKTYLFCIVHQPEQWTADELTRRIRPWIDEQLVDLVALSHHTAHYLRTRIINDWNFHATVTVRHLAPLFPVALPKQQFPLSTQGSSPIFQYPIAIYGDFDASRHDYSDAFEHIVALKQRLKSVNIPIPNTNETATQHREVSLRISGERVPPKPPKAVKPILKIDRELSYQQQYAILSNSYALLPAFSKSRQSDYVTKLASWSVPAALIAGVPPVAGEEILQAYGYLPIEAVWLKYGGENEMKVAERVALMSTEEHHKKRKVVQAAAKSIIQRNAELVDEWVQIGMRKIERQGWRLGA